MVGKHGRRTTLTKKVFTKNTIATETSTKKATSSPTILSKVIAPETSTEKAACTPTTFSFSVLHNLGFSPGTAQDPQTTEYGF
jgi:hypothetical protein